MVAARSLVALADSRGPGYWTGWLKTLLNSVSRAYDESAATSAASSALLMTGPRESVERPK